MKEKTTRKGGDSALSLAQGPSPLSTLFVERVCVIREREESHHRCFFWKQREREVERQRVVFLFLLHFFLSSRVFFLFSFPVFFYSLSLSPSPSLLPPPVPRPVLHGPVQVPQREARDGVEQRDGGLASAQLERDFGQKLVDGRRRERVLALARRSRPELSGEDPGEGRPADFHVAEVDVPALDVDIGCLACLKFFFFFLKARSERKAKKRRNPKPESKKKKASPIASASSS